MTDLINRRPAGFYYDFRPASYFEDVDLKTIVLASISGEHRRRDVEERLASGDFNPLVWGEWLTDSTLDPDLRSRLSSVHPSLMSGEYLPPMGAQDIEIARVVLASVTGDVISVRARRDHGSAGGIAYLVVDEYGTEYQLVQERSAQPLTLGELIALINTTLRDEDETGGGIAISHVVWHCEQGEGEGMRGFVRVESAFYPELNRFYDAVLDGYLDELDEVLRKEREEEERECGEEETPAAAAD